MTCGCFQPSNDPLVVGDRMLVPFCGRGTAHGGRRYRMQPARCRIGLLEFQRDRWGGADGRAGRRRVRDRAGGGERPTV